MSHSIGIPEFGVEIGKIVVPILGDFQKDFIICWFLDSSLELLGCTVPNGNRIKQLFRHRPYDQGVTVFKVFLYIDNGL